MIIVDTNVISEVLRPHPSEQVGAWLDAQRPRDLFVTTISQAEMLLGVQLLPRGRRRDLLETAINAIFDTDFRERVLPFDSRAARAFATIVANRRRLGKPIDNLDAQIAAIARSEGAAIATRDAAGFAGCGVSVIDPWSA